MTDQPLLSLAPSSAVLDDVNIPNIWNVITKASDLVKDGGRIENLAWRHWSRPRRQPSSASSLLTESSASIRTASVNTNDGHLHGVRPFGDSLKLLCDDNEFKDWVQEAKSSPGPSQPRCNGHAPAIGDNHIHYPQLSQAAHLLPKTPQANVEIRLVEPTPVPSRVGSLGASQTTALNTLLTTSTHIPPPVDEVDERESSPSPTSPHRPNRRGKFFVQSSPSKASGSESSPVAPPPTFAPSLTVKPAPGVGAADQRRRSSGSSTGASKKKRHVSLSTMRGKFAAEKRKAKAAIEAKEARDEDGGWEDDDEQEEEGWSSDGEQEASLTASPKEAPPPPAPTPLRKMSKKERDAAAAERARIEAELEAQRKREMFAKQQIFGTKSGLLKQELQRGGSMVDLTLRPVPTHKDLNEARSVPPGPSLMRSKSAVAIPVQTGVSVTIRSQTSGSGINESPVEDMSTRAQKAQPAQDYLETTDEESDDYLATSSTRRKLEALAAKRDKGPQPVPVASPTTDRRSLLTREMSESLRTNIIVERTKSSTNLAGLRPGQAPPPPRTSVLGRGFLRPLTRVGTQNPTATAANGHANATAGPSTGPSAHIARTQSSANFNVSPTSPAPPMTRSNTEGGGGGDTGPRARSRAVEERDELQRRSDHYDTSYRLHGW